MEHTSASLRKQGTGLNTPSTGTTEVFLQKGQCAAQSCVHQLAEPAVVCNRVCKKKPLLVMEKLRLETWIAM